MYEKFKATENIQCREIISSLEPVKNTMIAINNRHFMSPKEKYTLVTHAYTTYNQIMHKLWKKPTSVRHI